MQSRRNVLQFACTSLVAPAIPIWAFAKSNFWDEKDPAEWSDSERHKLLSNSPWAKNVSVSMGGGRGSGRSGGGGGRGGRGSSPGGGGEPMSSPPPLDLIVRWESAEPIHLARKVVPTSWEKSSYQISVSGFPDRGQSARGGFGRGFTGEQSGNGNDMAARLRENAKLEIKDKPALHSGQVERLQDAGQAILFHFDRGELPITVADKEVLFTLRLGAMNINAKFSPKTMIYKDQLSL